MLMMSDVYVWRHISPMSRLSGYLVMKITIFMQPVLGNGSSRIIDVQSVGRRSMNRL